MGFGVGILKQRFANQLLVESASGGPEEIVRWFGAVQGQDILASLWALGLRTAGSTEGEIEKAIEGGKIIRTWPMRGTLHYVPAEDAKWMLELMTPRIIAGSAKRYKDHDLNESTFEKAQEEIQSVLQGGKVVTRPDLMSYLSEKGIPTSGQRGYHILGYLAQKGFLCLGPRQGKQPTVVLLDEWVPEYRNLTREESLAEIATRYFRSHGPATLHDFVWWTGLTVADCRNAMDGISSQLELWRDGVRALWHMPTENAPEVEPEKVMLLPFVDEYTVGYRDRSDFLNPEYTERTFHGLMSVVISNGKIVGVWKRKLSSKRAAVELDLFRDLAEEERSSLQNTLRKYGAFLGKTAEIAG